MKRYIRETHQVLEGLGFVRHEDPFGRHDRVTYAHPYEPDQRIPVYVGATEAACKAIQANAKQIAGLGTSGADLPKTVGERKRDQRKKKSAEKVSQEKADQQRRERAAKAEAEFQRTQHIADAFRHEREISSLMQPGRGR